MAEQKEIYLTQEGLDELKKELDELKLVKRPEIINALKLLTHDKNTPYMEYVGEIKKNKIATKVKLADLRHNSDLTRLSVVDEKALERKAKYEKAIKFLEE